MSRPLLRIKSGAEQSFVFGPCLVGTQAALLAQQHGLKVVLMDPKLDNRWLPNYGVWFDEWRGKAD
jgi:hypothetical protein